MLQAGGTTKLMEVNGALRVHGVVTVSGASPELTNRCGEKFHSYWRDKSDKTLTLDPEHNTFIEQEKKDWDPQSMMMILDLLGAIRWAWILIQMSRKHGTPSQSQTSRRGDPAGPCDNCRHPIPAPQERQRQRAIQSQVPNFSGIGSKVGVSKCRKINHW